MGMDLKSQPRRGKDYSQAIQRLGEIFAHRLQYPWYWNDGIFKWTPLGREWTKDLKILHATTIKVIKDKKKELGSKGTDDVIIDDMSQVVRKRHRLAFLDLVIQAQRQNKDLTEEDIQEEVDTFMFGGHDTVSSAVSFAFYLLACNPHIQEKVHDELDHVLGNDRDKTITVEDLQKMEYMNCVIKECQRVLTTVPLVGRTLGSDKHLSQKFALLEQKAMMASVLRKVRFTTTQTFDQLGLVYELVLRASKGIYLKIHLRDN